MTAPPDDTTTDLHAVIAALRTERDAALAREAAMAEEVASRDATLAERNTEYSERIKHQAATVDVLKAMSASPGNAQPVFDLIVRQAKELCNCLGAALYEYDSELVHLRANHGGDANAAAAAKYIAMFPMAPTRASFACRAILDLEVVHIRDTDAELGQFAAMLDLERKAQLSVPLLRDGVAIGAIAIGAQKAGGFSDSQIELLKTFAGQAVIAITSAEIYRNLHEALEQQTATAEVLQVINASPGNLGPVFEAMLDKAMQLCQAKFGAIATFDGERVKPAALRGIPAAYADYLMRNPVPEGPGTIPGRIRGGERIVHIQDLMEEANYRNGHPDRRALVELGGARTSLSVALCKDDALLGMLSFYREEVRPFSERQIALLENFAAQAVIAMENARLLSEQREALEQQTATAEVLQVINSSPGNLAPVFDAMLEKALHLCEAAFGVLWTYDGEWLHAVALRGVPPAFAEFLTRTPHSVSPDSAHGRLLHGEPVVHIADVREDTAYQSGDPLRRTLVELGGGRTLLAAPLRKDETFLGDFVIYRIEVRPFSGKQIALLRNFTAQAVIAMENARLITETREALEQQTATAEVLQVINSSPGDLTPVFDAMLDRARKLCGADVGTFWYRDGASFRVVASSAQGDTGRTVIPAPGTSLDRIAHGADVVQIDDVTKEEGYRTGVWRERTQRVGTRTALAVPLRKDDELVGAITTGRREVRRFTENQIGLLQNFAAQAVIAMENARLLDEIRQRQAELRVTFDNMGDGVVMFDAKHRLAASNRNFQELLDIPDAALAKRPSYADYLRLLAERGEFGVEDIEADLARRLGDTDRELRLERTRPDGRVIELRRNPVPDGGFVLIYSDISERKRSEAEIRAARDAAEAAYRDLKAAQANLIQAEKMASLGQLTAGIAHEIKNPLNFVNNFAELSIDLLGELKDAIAPAEPALTDKQRAEVEEVSVMLSSNLEKITEHGKRADSIVKAMLEHSRGSSAERRVVDLNALIDEALNLAYHGARAQDQSFNITLERDFGEGISPIEVNPQDITRVFLNLFANGFYATTRRAHSDGEARFVPTLKVTTIDAGETVEIRVRDNGIGISDDIRDKLFQPFFTTKPTGEGTGLGLSITYDIVTQQHGGSITVDSKVGEYSEFTVRLPRGILASVGGRA